MRISTVLVPLALVADIGLASLWGPTAAYNKWHETELERWLSDHDIPYPTAADRKNLEKLVRDNWDSHVVTPYQHWDTAKLSELLSQKGSKSSSSASRDSLVSQVRDTWYETEDSAQNAWLNCKDWILDSWSESQLKSFCDYHGIPVPQPRKRDTFLEKARSNLQSVAKKAGDTAAYPGNWLYDSWTESDLKEWLDTYGFPAPQPTNRDKLIASVRRNSRLASLQAKDREASASSSAQAAYATLTDRLIDAWDETQLKSFCDKNGIRVPQGSKPSKLRALVRKHRAEVLGDTLSGSAASAFGAATSNAGNEYAKATDRVSMAVQDAFNQAVDTWSDSRLKAYLEARGVPVSHHTKKDELRALVRKNAHKGASGGTAWTLDDLSSDKLRQYLAKTGDSRAKNIGQKAGATRSELVSAARSAYASASSAGGSSYATATAQLAQATASAKNSIFEDWSESELKAYLDSYGIPVYQGTTLNDLKSRARKQYTFFKYGTTTPAETAFARVQQSAKDTWYWAWDQVSTVADAAKKKAYPYAPFRWEL